MTASFAADIAPLFTDGDARCMSGMGVRLRDFDYMAAGDAAYPDHGNARHVLARLKGTETPKMPLGGPGWDDARIVVRILDGPLVALSWMERFFHFSLATLYRPRPRNGRMPT